MINEQNNQEIEQGSDNAEYLEKKPSNKTTLSTISTIFYVFAILVGILMLNYFSVNEKEIKNMELFSYQSLVIGYYLVAIFMSFCFGKLFEAINRIDINTKKII
jgi:uncharacterized membrane protein